MTTAGRVCLVVRRQASSSPRRRAQLTPAHVAETLVKLSAAQDPHDAASTRSTSASGSSPSTHDWISSSVAAVRGLVEDFEGGVKIVFAVSERPFVRDVDFVGNKGEDRDSLQDKIDVKLGSVYNPVDVQRAVEKLRDFYEDEGYFEVQITPTVEKFADRT